ncbi:hypothetical protein [Candidatus Nitrospira neomarina]|uniref:Uncharacterized protein n=1 Tax=Candidatus Nitrospira neomarina TaxID=3020899 RepID=A0AA96GTL2_9BACT|nr:hypothetical protein [Candidatus Nitrospira neomarina]WNM63356.1 hypothetical protein PQG83_06265 [Candidatus Nitrospira neomarina]
MMKKLCLMVALGFLICGQPAYGATPGPQDPVESAAVSPLAQNRTATGMEVHKMMGHINIAYLALDINLPDDALHHIEQAEALAGQLTRDLPSMKIDSTFKYGKVTFTSRNANKHYYVPVLDDLFLLSEYDTVYRHLQSFDIKQTYAGIVKLDFSVDLRNLAAALRNAKQELSNKRYEKSQHALEEIFQGAIVEESVNTDPRLIIYDNLALAKNFIQNGLYPSARLTVVNVKHGLVQWEKDPRATPYTQGVHTLQREIARLDTALENKDPTLMQRVGRQFLAWRKIVELWF